MLRVRLHTSSRVRQFGFYRQEILPSRLGGNNKGAIKLKNCATAPKIKLN